MSTFGATLTKMCNSPDLLAEPRPGQIVNWDDFAFTYCDTQFRIISDEDDKLCLCLLDQYGPCEYHENDYPEVRTFRDNLIDHVMVQADETWQKVDAFIEARM